MLVVVKPVSRTLDTDVHVKPKVDNQRDTQFHRKAKSVGDYFLTETALG